MHVCPRSEMELLQPTFWTGTVRYGPYVRFLLLSHLVIGKGANQPGRAPVCSSLLC